MGIVKYSRSNYRVSNIIKMIDQPLQINPIIHDQRTRNITIEIYFVHPYPLQISRSD